MKLKLLIFAFVFLLLISVVYAEFEGYTKEECESIVHQIPRDECFYEVAIKNNDFSICEGIEYEFKKAECYSEIAIKNNDLSVCEDLIVDDWYEGRCEKKFLENLNLSLSFCENIKEMKVKNICYFELAVQLRKKEGESIIGFCDDDGICYLIKESDDPSICDNIKDDHYEFVCSNLFPSTKKKYSSYQLKEIIIAITIFILILAAILFFSIYFLIKKIKYTPKKTNLKTKSLIAIIVNLFPALLLLDVIIFTLIDEGILYAIYSSFPSFLFIMAAFLIPVFSLGYWIRYKDNEKLYRLLLFLNIIGFVVSFTIILSLWSIGL